MLASESGCSNDVVFETEDLNSLVGNCEGTLSGCQSCL